MNINRIVHNLALLIGIFLVSCESRGNISQKQYLKPLTFSNVMVSPSEYGFIENKEFCVNDTIDLQGRTIRLPKGVTLSKKGKGIITNGCMLGNETKINCQTQLFDRVKIGGTWIVPTIKSSLFADLNYDNSLQDVLALSNPALHNKIIIDKGHYQVSAKKSGDACLTLSSNTNFILNGCIELIPNSFESYSVMRIIGNNVKVSGKGFIIGDKDLHTGKSGEWGMGIFVAANRVKIEGLTIKNCWGDCVYIGKRTNDVDIENCKITNGRRQGISITSASNVRIGNTVISDVSGTLPECAIDIEPNKNDTVSNVVIDNVSVKNCKSGIATYGKASNSMIDKIIIKGCKIEQTMEPPLSFCYTSQLEVHKCIMMKCRGDVAISCIKVMGAEIISNQSSMELSTMDKIKRFFLRDDSDAISIKDCENVVIR